VWQWVRAGIFGEGDVRRIMGEEIGDDAPAARELFERLALADEFVEFLTLEAYDQLP
jgi:hypothetical protein